jgi:hypothetical protein
MFCRAAVALGTLVACTQIAGSQGSIWAQKKARYDSAIGKTFWVKFAVQLCSTPNSVVAECAEVSAPTRLVIDRIEPQFQGIAGGGLPFCHATSDDGRVGHVMCSQLVAFATDVDPTAAAAECKRRGEPRIGMSAKQVEVTCWGKPVTVKRKETASGITDKYVYDDGRSVLFRNGVVVTIRTVGVR